VSVRASLAVKRTIVRDTARTLGARVVILEASTPSEIESVCATMVRERLGALVISGENFFLSQRDRLVELAARQPSPNHLWVPRVCYGGRSHELRKRYGWCLSQRRLFVPRWN
jgi:hypothetical protein